MKPTALFNTVPLLLMICIMVTEFAAGVYLPSMPAIGLHYGVTDDVVATTISLNLLGIAVSGPLYGPLSDSYGRRPILLGGIFLFCFGSFLCLLSDGIGFLVFARFIQGLGEGVAAVLSMASVRDMYSEKDCARVYSTMDMGIVIAPALAPIVGGHMTRYFGWQSNFHLLMLLSCSILVTLLAFFPETHPPKERVGFSGKTILKIYTQLFKNPEFMGNAVISGLVFAGYWVFIATAPYLFIETFGLDEATYSYYCLCGVGAYMVGAWVNRIMVRYFSLNQILAAGLLWMVLLSVLAMGVGFLFPRSPLVISMVAALYTGAMALVFVNTSTRAMQSLPDYSGFSAALLLTCEMAFSSAGAAISSLIFKGTFMSIASLMSLLAFLAFGLYMFMERKRKRKSNYSACHPRIGGDPY